MSGIPCDMLKIMVSVSSDFLYFVNFSSLDCGLIKTFDLRVVRGKFCLRGVSRVLQQSDWWVQNVMCTVS